MLIAEENKTLYSKKSQISFFLMFLTTELTAFNLTGFSIYFL